MDPRRQRQWKDLTYDLPSYNIAVTDDFSLLSSSNPYFGSSSFKIYSIGPWIMFNHSVKFHKDLISSFWVSVIRLTDRQTDRQTDRHRWKHNLLGEVIRYQLLYLFKIPKVFKYYKRCQHCSIHVSPAPSPTPCCRLSQCNLPFPFGRICFVVLVMRKGGESSWSGPWHLGCTLEDCKLVFHVHSYKDQFIQPGWAECVFLCI